MLNKTLVFRKISLIQNDLIKLTELSKFTLDEIVSDYLKQNSLERLLEKIIMRAVDINEHILAESKKTSKISPPKTYKETFTVLNQLEIYSSEFGSNISKSIGLRNLLVHEYDTGIDYTKLYNSVGDCLRDYHQYCEYIIAFVEKN